MINQVRRYLPARLSSGKVWFVEFYAFDPVSGDMRRKRIRINRIKNKRERKAYALDLIKHINEQLAAGWNPWINRDIETYSDFTICLDSFEENLTKFVNSGYYREETYRGYKSHLQNLRDYTTKTAPISYTFQFDKKYVSRFLDHIFIERDNKAQTRNNYLAFLKVFVKHLCQKGLLDKDVTEGIPMLSRKLYSKTRTVIDEPSLKRIHRHLHDHDRHFLLACLIQYYCLVRPVEMTRLRIGDFNVKKSTLTLRKETTKNRKTQTVTVPRLIWELMLDLGIFNHSSDEFLFSDGLLPGSRQIDTVNFRHRWDALRKELKLPKEYQFYSLKDSGITDMLRAKVANISVRDQARHSSLSVTDLYTPHDGDDADPALLNFKGML